jgi:transposase InsO family protein
LRAFFGRAIARAKGNSPRLSGEGPGVRAREKPRLPKYIVCDRGSQFWNDGFKRWCKRKGVKPRFGAVGKHGSISVVERVILTINREFPGVPGTQYRIIDTSKANW